MSTANDNSNSVSGYNVSLPPPASSNGYAKANYTVTFIIPGLFLIGGIVVTIAFNLVDSEKHINPDNAMVNVIRNKISKYSIILVLLWVLLFLITNFIILSRVLSMNKGVIRSNLIQNSCNGQPMEGETVRYRMIYEMGKNGNDNRTFAISGLLSLMMSIWLMFFVINDTSPIYNYRALICLFGGVFLGFTLWYCFLIGNYAKEPYGWYKSAVVYQEKFETLKGFAAVLQEKYNKNQSIPQEYSKLRYNLVKRIAQHNKMANIKDAFRKFANASSTYVAEFFRLNDKDDDATLILTPLLCKNMYKNYYPNMLYTFLADKTVWPSALGSQDRSTIETHVKTKLLTELNNEYDVMKKGNVESYVGSKRSRIATAIQVATDYNSSEFTVSYDTINKKTIDNLATMKSDVNSPLFVSYFNSLTIEDVFEFIPWKTDVNREGVIRKFKKIHDSTTIATDDPNVKYCNTNDKLINDPFFSNLNVDIYKLASAVNNLKDINYGDPSAYTRESNPITIAYFSLIFGICFIGLFHKLYRNGYKIILILVISITFICIAISSNMFMFA